MEIDDKLRRRVAKIEAVLLSQNPPVRSREQLIAGKDKGTKYTDYKGIGKVYGKTLRWCCDHLDIEGWYSVFQQVRWDAQDTGPDTDSVGGQGGGSPSALEEVTVSDNLTITDVRWGTTPSDGGNPGD